MVGIAAAFEGGEEPLMSDQSSNRAAGSNNHANSSLRPARVRLGWLWAAALTLLLGPAMGSLAADLARCVPGRLVVKLRREADDSTLTQLLQPYSAHARRTLRRSNVRLVHLAEKDAERALEMLRRHATVEFAERDYLAAPAWVPSDPDLASGQTWHLAKVQAPAAWDVTPGATNIVVAVLDSGVQFSHPDLSGRVLAGYDFINDDADPSDDYGHGTAVAGVIAAAGNNNVGGAGVAFGCLMLPIKVCGADGTAPYSAIADGIRFAVDHGARIINISLVGDQTSATLQDAVNYAWERNAVIVAAAGNTGDPTAQYPAACQNAVAVSASALNDGLCTFSSYGPNITVAAPGESLWTTQMRTNAPFGAWSGTSLAAPVAAGVVALAASANSSLSNTQLVSILTQSADDVGSPGNDSFFGAGRVNAVRAVQAALNVGGVVPPPVILTQPASQSVVVGNAAEFYVEASGAEPRTFQWKHDGANIPGATNNDYSLAAVQAADAGLYTVEVSNPAGSVLSQAAALSLKPAVNFAPSVTLASPLDGAKVRLGTAVTLVANATDSDGVVLGVTFLSSGVALGAATNAAAFPSAIGTTIPFSVTWQPARAGSYSIAAVAVDEAGLNSTSAPVVLQVLPPDTNRPTVSLTLAPANNTRIPTPVVSLTGTARDDQGLDHVEISLNNGPFVRATGASNWNVQVTLAAGSNTLRVRSVDAAGNVSVETKRVVTLVVNLPVVVLTNGVGTVSSIRNGQLLEVGKVYKLTAKPGAGQVFAGWEGIASVSATVNFTMQSNLVLVAKFIPNPFLQVKGNYAGLFWNTNGVQPADSGRFNLTVTSAGSFSGKLVLGTKTFSFTGVFGARGTTTVAIARSGLTQLRLALSLDFIGNSDQVLGTLSDGSWTSVAQGNRNVFTSANPAPQAGLRSFQLLSVGDSPQSVAAGSAQISASGSVKVSGKMSDGRAYSSAATLAKNGDYPFHLVLSNGSEILLGWMNFPAIATNSTPGGNLVWTSVATNGFSRALQVVPGS